MLKNLLPGRLTFHRYQRPAGKTTLGSALGHVAPETLVPAVDIRLHANNGSLGHETVVRDAANEEDAVHEFTTEYDVSLPRLISMLREDVMARQQDLTVIAVCEANGTRRRVRLNVLADNTPTAIVPLEGKQPLPSGVLKFYRHVESCSQEIDLSGEQELTDIQLLPLGGMIQTLVKEAASEVLAVKQLCDLYDVSLPVLNAFLEADAKETADNLARRRIVDEAFAKGPNGESPAADLIRAGADPLSAQIVGRAFRKPESNVANLPRSEETSESRPGRCATCVFWGKEGTADEHYHMRQCLSQKLYSATTTSGGDVPDDGALHEDAEGIGFVSAPSFGCVNWTARNPADFAGTGPLLDDKDAAFFNSFLPRDAGPTTADAERERRMVDEYQRDYDAAARRLGLPATDPAVTRSPDVCGGAACVRHTRIPIWMLVASRRLGANDDFLLAEYPGLTRSKLEVAWLYAHRYPALVAKDEDNAIVPPTNPATRVYMAPGEDLGDYMRKTAAPRANKEEL